MLIVDAIDDGVGGKSAEDDRVHGADASAGQHGDGKLRHHAHVDRDAVSLADAKPLERVGEALDFGEQLRRR